MVRDKVGSYYEEAQLEKWLSNGSLNIIDGDPKNSNRGHQVPAAAGGAKISIVPNEENPGYYAATFECGPHYQLEGMDIGLRSCPGCRLPSKRMRN